MKTNIVLWGSNEQEEKLLVALALNPNTSLVTIYTFPAAIVTEEFANLMMNKWRIGNDIVFPDGYTEHSKELSLSGSLLPEDIKVDKPDILNRAQTEWQFVVLSQKLKDSFDTELEDLKERISELTRFDKSIWEELKAYWNKVQTQVRERNLFREHANNLKEKTNELFSELKSMRKKLDEEFNTLSKKHFETFTTNLETLEKKIEEGLSLQPIFEELKQLQHEFRETTFTREDRSRIWNRLDKAFKTVKEKRFGKADGSKHSTLDRLKRRYDGLLNAITKMEKSIARDNQDLKFEHEKINSSEGQLEAQIRQAKTKMIEERIRSKNEKLSEMNKTKTHLEQKMEVEKKKQESKKEKERFEEAKEEIKEKIAADIKKAAEERKADIEKLSSLLQDDSDKPTDATLESDESTAVEEAKPASQEDPDPNPEQTVDIETQSDASEELTSEVEQPKETDETSEPKPEQDQQSPKQEENQDESLLTAVSSAIGESVEDMVDTVKAVASVIGDKLEQKFEEYKGESGEEE